MMQDTSQSAQGTSATTGHRYRMDPVHSRFTVQGFAGGLLSFMAHNPTFLVRDFDGELRWTPDALAAGRLSITLRTNSLDLLDKVRPADREDMMGRMWREVLEIDAYPEIRFHAEEIATTPVGPDRYRMRITGLLSLHGVTNREAIDADLADYSDGVHLSGAAFDIAAWKEER